MRFVHDHHAPSQPPVQAQAPPRLRHDQARVRRQHNVRRLGHVPRRVIRTYPLLPPQARQLFNIKGLGDHHVLHELLPLAPPLEVRTPALLHLLLAAVLRVVHALVLSHCIVLQIHAPLIDHRRRTQLEHVRIDAQLLAGPQRDQRHGRMEARLLQLSDELHELRMRPRDEENLRKVTRRLLRVGIVEQDVVFV